MMKYELEIRQFLSDKFLFSDDGQIDAHASLVEAGIIDSTGVLELISFLEEHFKIEVKDDELTTENLDTIGDICVFLSKKLA